ncbi:hypothetical protein HK101_004411 [Irineochytrium annulatum]|nr:hypothetical protein HK101_004411 [Irineochytrium annulatum]
MTDREKYKFLKRKLREVRSTLDDLVGVSKKLLKAASKIKSLEMENGLLRRNVQQSADGNASDSDSSSGSSSGSSSDSSSGSDSEDEARPAHKANGHNHRPSSFAHPTPAATTSTTTPSAPTPSIVAPIKPRAPQVHRIQRIPTDDNGAPLLPLQIGVVVIHALGHIVSDRPTFHTERYIYTPGFKSSRSYMSIVDPSKNVTYECTITDGGDAPRFVVTPEDAPDRASVGVSATGAWNAIVKAAHALRGREHSNSGVSGPEFFGISQKAVMKLIQDLPGARECTGYVWKKFEYITGRGSKRLLRPGEEAPPPSKKKKSKKAPIGAHAAHAARPAVAAAVVAPAGGGAGTASVNGGGTGDGGSVRASSEDVMEEEDGRPVVSVGAEGSRPIGLNGGRRSSTGSSSSSSGVASRSSSMPDEDDMEAGRAMET